MTADIIDRIDELVDDSLAAGEPAGGYENWNPEPDPDYPRCPHCGRHWHGLPITARIADMYARRWYDPGYEYARDTSPVLCDGSDIIGPRRPLPTYPSRKHGPLISGVIAVSLESGWADAMARLREAIENLGAQATAFVTSYTQTGEPVWTFTAGSYRLPADPGIAPRCLRPPITIEFGPQNWHHEMMRPRLQFPRQFLWSPLKIAVRNAWHDFTAPDVPTPPRPGYDFTRWATDDHPTTGPEHHHGWNAIGGPRRPAAAARRRNERRRRQ